MSEYTPSPWKADYILGNDPYEDPDLPFVDVGDVKWSPNMVSIPSALQQYTDAYLIAAAPDLLEALEGLMMYGTNAPISKVKEAKKAIAKAKGEQE